MRNQPKPGFRITEIHAFTAVGADTEEGIIGMQMGDVYVPFVAADLSRLHQLRILAQEMANRMGQTITISKFTTREDVGKIRPFPNEGGPDAA